LGAVALPVAATSCGPAGRSASGSRPPAENALFTLRPPEQTGIRFENRLEETAELNVFTYRNFYNGGGVALGDLTGDGLPELLLTSNLGPHHLYLNLGGFRFREISEAAGLVRRGAWATGVTLADVNGDGRLDIYVCYAGNAPAERRRNELFVHQGLDAAGMPTFREEAAQYGVADPAYSTHAAFFDYDRDGDLDLYLLNNSPRPVSSFSLRNIRPQRDSLGGDKLYRNDGGRFQDVSGEAGIFGPEFAFGLGLAVGDLDRDGWPDLYVANDFFERDYLYLNNRDGTFRERLEDAMSQISLSSMGLDVADIDDDGLLDLFVTDMLPEDDHRFKTTATFEDWDGYRQKVRNGYHHQFMRNTLQRNNGDGTFSEVGQMAGVARTDWSWSGLIADFDLDGHKDIHVTNGILRDVTSQDYLAFLAADETMAAAARGKRVDFLGLIDRMGSTPLANYAFRNRGHAEFQDVSADWGLDASGFSNGAAYGDLDADGDLDLVVSNLNDVASVYRNNAREQLGNRYLQVQLEGEGANRFAVGAKVSLRSGDRLFFHELMPSRGFQSSSDYLLTFGVGTVDSVDSARVDWPDGRTSSVERVATNRRLILRQAESRTVAPAPTHSDPPILEVITEQVLRGEGHRENPFVDFQRERLMPRMLSREGPRLAVADLNGDGLDDMYLGGAKDQAGQLLIQRGDGQFVSVGRQVFEADRISEDIGAAFFDADGDGDRDLYVVSGGSEFSDRAPGLQDRLYLNDGRAGFREAEGALPPMTMSGGPVAPADVDGDGDLDLFVGGRVVPWAYGTDPPSALLRNDGRGRFRDVTSESAPALTRIGMVTDAVWTDLDRDGRPDLVVVGEWMPIVIFHNAGGGKLEPLSTKGLERSHGWWNRIVAGDFTGDGLVDFVAGNFGLNSRLRASDAAPVTMYVKDFDQSGFVEQILSVQDRDTSRPLVLRDELLATLPSFATRYPTYESFARATVEDIFGTPALSDATVKRVHTLSSSLARNNGDGSFSLIPLPRETQQAPVYAILPGDHDRDGHPDLLLAGNFDAMDPKIGRMAGSYGWLLRGDPKATDRFVAVGPAQSGFVVPGQARDIARVRTRGRGGELIVVARNDDRPLVFRRGSGRGTTRTASH
jgi:hypothetical protein